MFIKLEMRLQGFLSLSVIFSGNYISFYILLMMTIARLSFYCLQLKVQLHFRSSFWFAICTVGALG